ncbi:MAG: hypothetical protein E6Q97_12600 [Desulfurellales bacterium]|nr:MAG: hypothetical protein E6Q97_12600 [Desulfurellales bacterium]
MSERKPHKHAEVIKSWADGEWVEQVMAQVDEYGQLRARFHVMIYTQSTSPEIIAEVDADSTQALTRLRALLEERVLMYAHAGLGAM